MSQLFSSGGQSIGASASASVLPMNIQGVSLIKLKWTFIDSRGSKNASHVVGSFCLTLGLAPLSAFASFPPDEWEGRAQV